jgi:hypothetical protein
VFVALLRCDDESKLAAASGSVVDVTTSMSVPAAQVAVAPVNDTTTTTEEEARPACAPRLHDGTSTASAALSLTDFDEWFASLRAAILASVERKLAAALQVLREVLPTVSTPCQAKPRRNVHCDIETLSPQLVEPPAVARCGCGWPYEKTRPSHPSWWHG